MAGTTAKDGFRRFSLDIPQTDYDQLIKMAHLDGNRPLGSLVRSIISEHIKSKKK